LDLEHVLSKLEFSHLDLAILDVLLDLIVCKLCQFWLKGIEFLPESLPTGSIVWHDGILDEFILIFLVFNIDTVELFLDVSFKSLESIEDFLVSINQFDGWKRVFHRDIDLVSHKSSCLNGILHPLNVFLSLFINQRVAIFRNRSEMDALCLFWRTIFQPIL